MKPLLKRLENGEVLVADGAMGSMLIERGLEPGECPESWNLTRPEVLEEIAQSYLDAGAAIIQTNTFGGSPMRLADYGLDVRTEEINESAVSIVRRVIKDRAYLSGSCGPSGKILEPYGDASPEDLQRGFQRQIEALAGAGVDLICVETMIDLNEAVLAVKAAKTVSPATPVMATMTFEKTPNGFFTVMGASVTEAVRGLEQAGAEIVGSNCGNGLEIMVEIAREFSKATDLPLIIQSNAGLPESRDGKLFYTETPGFFAGKTAELVDAGVSIIGGCCGTTPEHIRRIAEVIA